MNLSNHDNMSKTWAANSTVNIYDSVIMQVDKLQSLLLLLFFLLLLDGWIIMIFKLS